jgi:hypothetical protein
MSDDMCDAIVIHCMDFRLQKFLNDWLEQRLGTHNYDRVGLAGGVFDIETVMKQVEASNGCIGSRKYFSSTMKIAERTGKRVPMNGTKPIWAGQKRAFIPPSPASQSKNTTSVCTVSLSKSRDLKGWRGGYEANNSFSRG